MGVELAPKLRHLQPNPLQFRIGFFIARQPPKFFDIFLEVFDGALAVGRFSLGLIFLVFLFFFFFRSHAATTTTACSPQTCRTASANSGEGLTRCAVFHIATDPFEWHSSNTTWQLPGASANKSSRWLSVSAPSSFSSTHTRNAPAAGRSLNSSSNRASCSERRVPDSSTCTRTFISNGFPGFRT